MLAQYLADSSAPPKPRDTVDMLQRFVFLSALLFSLGLRVDAASNPLDGDWVLTAEGNELMIFGTRRIAGGLSVNWQTEWRFRIADGRFKHGSGQSRLLDEPQPFSRPGHMFSCRSEEGVFVSASQQTYTTPHVRLKGFPVAGNLEGERLELSSSVDFPGNYVAVVYRCETENTVGDIWLQRAPLAGLERARRQNAESGQDEGVYHARVKEVRMIPPQGQLSFPLIDGWSMEWQDDTRERAIRYRLERLNADQPKVSDRG